MRWIVDERLLIQMETQTKQFSMGQKRVKVKRGFRWTCGHTAQINQFVTYLHLIIAEWLQPIITNIQSELTNQMTSKKKCLLI